jgi:hypothetical protein
MVIAHFARRVSLLLLALLLGLMAACGGSSGRASVPPYELNATPPPGLSGTQLLAWHVLHDVRPPRNLIALATALKQVAGPIPTVARTTPLNEKVNADDTFWVGPNQQIHATLVYITPHVYDYLEDGVKADLSALRASADRFESSLYVANQRYYGSEWSPGVDGDVHITILNADDLPPTVNGLFNSNDEYTTPIFPYSNQRELIAMHLGPNNLTPNTDEYDKTLAHEFERMIQWHLRPSDPTWMVEGMAVLAQHLNGFDASQTDTAFFATPDTQLEAWDGSAAHYGAAYLFMDYFAEHYGGYTVLKQLMDDPAQAPLNFNDVLAANGYTDRFDDVFAKWVMANALNDEPQSSNSAYAYKNVEDEHAQPQHVVSALPFQAQDTSPQYAATYYDAKMPANGDQTLHIAFTGQPAVPLISAPMPNGAHQFWWSNRGENMDSTLTHDLDLTGLAGQPVTLNFALWYDLEPNDDYGYVEVSTDNGAKWNALPIAGSHSDDPNNLNEGNGLTGDSNGWQNLAVDLSPYAGKKIQLRFETITDETVDQQGMAVANIAIPQAHFSDDASSADGWQAKGWLAGNNTLPETYSVQAALFDSGGSFTKVVAIPISADGTGQLDVPHIGAAISRVIVAVAPLAPATTMTASFTLSLSAS